MAYDSDGTTETIENLVAAINADATVGALVTAKANGDGSFLVNAIEPGETITLSLTTDAATDPDSYASTSNVIEAQKENWAPAGRSFETSMRVSCFFGMGTQFPKSSGAISRFPIPIRISE